MHTLKQEYRRFLENNFKGLRLRRPLFYNWNFGLRFGLHLTTTAREDEYFFEATNRASAIFQTAFDPSDELIFALMRYKHKRRKICPSNYAFKQLADLQKEEIFYTKEINLYHDIDGCSDRYNTALVKIKTARINHQNILTAIAHADFQSRRPRLEPDTDVYFINPGKRLIFMMYDDRGLDLIAANKETLRPIYEKHNEWIHDYDRERIDKLFVPVESA